MTVHDLVLEIESDTEASSFGSDRVNHARFKDITTMGMSAVPELIALLDSDHEMLVASLALSAIVGQPTIPKEHYGNLTVITEYWKQWYTKQSEEM